MLVAFYPYAIAQSWLVNLFHQLRISFITLKKEREKEGA